MRGGGRRGGGGEQLYLAKSADVLTLAKSADNFS